MRQLLLTGTVLGVLLLCVLGGRSTSPTPLQAEPLRQAENLRWYKGNLHTHSLWSDGDDFLENIALWYRDHGYDFLGFTDHNVLATSERWIDVEKAKSGRIAYEKAKQLWGDRVQERMQDGRQEVRLKTFTEVSKLVGLPDKFLLIQGEEISDKFGKLPIHLNANNIQQAIPPLHGDGVTETIQNNVDAVWAQRERTGEPILIHLNHPNFGWGVTAEELFLVRGENFFEVYNGHPTVYNAGDDTHASTDRLWDIMLTRRLAETDLPLMYGLGTDDGHSYHNMPSRASEPGRAWVMVLAEALTPRSLIESLEAGRFYASSGVMLESVTSSTAGIDLEIRAEPDVTYRTEFIGTRKGFDAASEPVKDKDGKELPVTRRYSDDVGRVLATVEGAKASYRCTGDELYVRARVTSSKPHSNPSELGDPERAWVQPVRGPGVP